nr:aminoacyl-tRNA synthetase, class 1a, anticodon-binding [Tanacetum cinerariifolium]
VLSDSENEEEERQSKELDALLDLANASLHEPSVSTTPSKPAHPKQSSKQEISPTTLDVVLTLSKSKARAKAATIIYKRLKKKKSSSGLDFTEVDIPAARLVSASGLDSAGGVDSAGGLTSAAPTAKELADQQAAILEAERQELLEQELKQNIDAEQVYLDSLLAQRVAEEHDRESMASAVQSTQRQAELDRVALNLTNEEMVELMNRRRKAIAKMKAKAKREKPMTPAQQKEFMRTFVKNQSSVIYTTGWTWKDVRGLTDDQLRIVYDKIQRAVNLATAKAQHQQLKRSGETLKSSKSKKLKSSHSTTQPAELQETTYVSAGVPIAAGDPIPAVTSVFVGFSVSAGSSIPAATPIAAGVSTTAGASGSASEASVPVIELFDSPPKDTSLPLDPKTDELDEHLRKSSRKKSIARKRTLPSPSKPQSAALPFDEDDPEAAFKRYLRQASDDDEPAEPVSLALVSNITTWEIIPTEFGRSEIHVIIRADVLLRGIGLGLWMDLRILITSREERDAYIIWDDQDQWQIRSWKFYAIPVIHVLETEAGDIMYMFVDKKYPLTPATLQRMLNHGLEIDRDLSGLMSQMIVYDGLFCHLALLGTMGGLYPDVLRSKMLTLEFYESWLHFPEFHREYSTFF